MTETQAKSGAAQATTEAHEADALDEASATEESGSTESTAGSGSVVERSTLAWPGGMSGYADEAGPFDEAARDGGSGGGPEAEEPTYRVEAARGASEPAREEPRPSAEPSSGLSSGLGRTGMVWPEITEPAA